MILETLGSKRAVKLFCAQLNYSVSVCVVLLSCSVYALLGKAFEITYVRLKFHSSRPESFAIYKRTSENGTWIPFQFYSATCQETYRLPVSAIIYREHEAQAICEDDYSDISPLTGGSIAFSTLSGRPSAHNFEHSPVLQVDFL